MNKKEEIENYLLVIGQEIKISALEAKEKYAASRGTDDESYKMGYLMAFHRIISLMQQEAELTFNISLEKIGLNDFDVDRDLF